MRIAFPLPLPLPLPLRLLGPVLLLVGCATGREEVASQRRVVATDDAGHVYWTTDVTAVQEVHVHAAANAALAALAQVYGDLGIPLGDVQSAAGVIGNRHYRLVGHSLGGRRASVYLDCGLQPVTNMPRADSYDLTISVVSSVEPQGADLSNVRTDVRGEAHAVGVSNTGVYCPSTGGLEQAIHNRLEARLAGR